MSNLNSEYADISLTFIQYIASFKYEIEKYALIPQAKDWKIKDNIAKLEELYTIKNRYDTLFNNILFIQDEMFNTGKQSGYKEALKVIAKQENPYDCLSPHERESFREVSIQNAKEREPHLY